MVTRELHPAAEPTQKPAAVTRTSQVAQDLAEPLAAIIDGLEQLALSESDAPGEAATPELIWRARHLAGELAQTIGALGAGLPEPIDARAPHSTLLVRHAIARAADVCADRLGTRRVVVRCSSQLAVTTQPGRFHDLLVTMIEESARRRAPASDVRVGARRVGTRIVVETEGSIEAGAGIERLQHLARAIGGHIEVNAGGEGRPALRVHLPQLRADDVDELPDDVA